MKVLELFCGTKSFAKVFEEYGYEVFTVDIDDRFKPDLVIDIMDLKANDIPFKPDVIWASPPCKSFSVAALGKNWKKEGKEYLPTSDRAIYGMNMVKKTIQLINELKPKYWFIENPRAMLRKQSFMEELPIRHTVTYCQYGDTRMKPTDIWTNCEEWKPKPPCNNGDPCHISAPRGSVTGTQGLKNAIERGRVPEELCKEILLVCEKNI